MPKRAAEVLPQVGALVEGPAAYGHLSGRANLALIDAAGNRRSRPDPRQPDRRRAGAGGPGRHRRPPGQAPTRWACASGSAWPPRCCARPRLLVLDEPTNGLDPQGIREIRDLLLELNAAGTTVFLSSHLLAEVEQLCTRVGVWTAAGWSCRKSWRPARADRALGRASPPTPTGPVRCWTAGSSRATVTGWWSARADTGRAQRAAGRRRRAGRRDRRPSGAAWKTWCSR